MTNATGGAGVIGNYISSGGGSGVYGFSNMGYGVRAEGGLAQLWLTPSGFVGAPSTDNTRPVSCT